MSWKLEPTIILFHYHIFIALIVILFILDHGALSTGSSTGRFSRHHHILVVVVRRFGVANGLLRLEVRSILAYYLQSIEPRTSAYLARRAAPHGDLGSDSLLGRKLSRSHGRG
jgi:hypothetical protein